MTRFEKKPSGIPSAALSAGANYHKAVAPQLVRQADSFHEYMRRFVPAKSVPTIAICGKLGTGKTLVALHLATHVYRNAFILDTDNESVEYFNGIASVMRCPIEPSGDSITPIVDGTRKLVKEMKTLRQNVARLHRITGSAVLVPYPLGEPISKNTDGIPPLIKTSADVTLHVHRSGKFPGEHWVFVTANRLGLKRIAFNITEPKA